MSNISKCQDKDCPSKDKCYRYTATANEYTNFNREQDAYNCEMFIEKK